MFINQIFEGLKNSCKVCGQTPCNCTHISEEKVRLDPKCWKGKKIGNPKTKMKGGVRVNNCVPESVAEGAGNIGNKIKALYQKIYDQGDDAIEFAYNDSPIFAQYWDEYEGDLDSIIAEVDASELQIILDELESAAEDQGLAEGFNTEDPGELNLNDNPSKGQVWARYMAIYDYDGYAGNQDEMDALENYAEAKFGGEMANQMRKAGYQSYFGRDDGKGPGTYGGDRLGSRNQINNPRMTKSGVMHKQDIKSRKDSIKGRLGTHGDSDLPEDMVEGSDTTTFNEFHEWKEAVYNLGADITQMGKSGQYTAMGSNGVIGEFNGRINKGWLKGQQGVAEGENDLVGLGPALHGLTGEFNRFKAHDNRMQTDPAYAKKWNDWFAKLAGHDDYDIYDDPDDEVNEQGVAEGWTKLPSGDYQNSHTGVRTSKPPVKKKRGEKTGAEWDAIAKQNKDQGVAEMDKSQPSHGRDGKISHSTYGSRDKQSNVGGKEHTAKMTTADQMTRDAHDAMIRSMSTADKEASYDKKYQDTVKRAGQAAKNIEQKFGPVDISSLAKRLNDIEQGKK